MQGSSSSAGSAPSSPRHPPLLGQHPLHRSVPERGEGLGGRQGPEAPTPLRPSPARSPLPDAAPGLGEAACAALPFASPLRGDASGSCLSLSSPAGCLPRSRARQPALRRGCQHPPQRPRAPALPDATSAGLGGLPLPGEDIEPRGTSPVPPCPCGTHGTCAVARRWVARDPPRPPLPWWEPAAGAEPAGPRHHAEVSGGQEGEVGPPRGVWRCGGGGWGHLGPGSECCIAVLGSFGSGVTEAAALGGGLRSCPKTPRGQRVWGWEQHGEGAEVLGAVRGGAVGVGKHPGGLQSQVGTSGWGRAQLAGRESHVGGQGWGPGGCPQQGLGSTGGLVQPRLCRAGVFGVLLAPCLHPPCVSAPRDLPCPCRGAVALQSHPRGQRDPKQHQTLWQRAPSVPPEQGAQNGGAATAANSQQMRSRHRKARCQGSSCCPSLRGVGALQRVFR